MNKLDGKTAIITGGTQGLGVAIARCFAESGVTGLVTCGRSSQKGESVAADIRAATGVPVNFVQADLGIVADCRKVVAEADAKFGRIDVLVNAAAITDRGSIVDTSEELFDQMVAVNVRGPFFLMQDAIKIMLREGVSGSIINIGSTSALAGQPFISAYCMSKGALATLTRNTAFGVMRNKIRVNQLNIGWMASDGEDRIQKTYHGADDDWLEQASAAQPYGRLVQPEEVAKAVRFMASDDAGLMSGAVVNFDQSVWGAYDGAPPTPAEAMSWTSEA